MLNITQIAMKAANYAAKKQIQKSTTNATTGDSIICHPREHFGNLKNAINNATTIDELQSAINDAQDAINSLVSSLKKKLSELLPAMRVLRLPGASFGSIIGWINDFVRFIIKPLLKPILSIVCELTNVSMQISELSAAIAEAEKTIKTNAQTYSAGVGTAIDTAEKYASLSTQFTSTIGSLISSNINDPGQGGLNSYVERKKFTVNITANTQNIDLWNYVDQNSYTPMISDFIITVANNVIVGSSSNGGSAMTITTWNGITGFEPGNYLNAANGQSIFVSGDTVTIINNGFIVGDLGQYIATSNSTYYGPTSNVSPHGTGLAMNVAFPISLVNNGMIGGSNNAIYDIYGNIVYVGNAISGNTFITFNPQGDVRGKII